MAGVDLGIDLGTTKIIIYRYGKGIVLEEPSVVAYHTKTEKVVAVGHEALRMLGRTPAYIRTECPIRDGVISNLSLIHIFETGIRHGTVTVLLDGQPLEITTYRIDGSYSDSRHPDEVRFTASLKEDLARRDFTVNALAYHPNAGIVDCFGDVYKRQARCHL